MRATKASTVIISNRIPIYINSKQTTAKRMPMYSFDTLKAIDKKSNPGGLQLLLYSAI